MAGISFKDIKLDQLESLAEDLFKSFPESKVFAFAGEMGVGKTTLIASICKKLGVTESISSPTFSLVNEYHSAENGKIFHFDLYRLKNAEEVVAMGFEEYLYSGSYCFIEWPQIIKQLLPPETLHLELSRTNNGLELNASLMSI